MEDEGGRKRERKRERERDREREREKEREKEREFLFASLGMKLKCPVLLFVLFERN